jgi:hypothetical protein
MPRSFRRIYQGAGASSLMSNMGRELITRAGFLFEKASQRLDRVERLVTPDRRAEIEIYSLPNKGCDMPRSYLAEKLKLNPAALHYKRVTPRFFVLSAAANGRIYYTRCNFSQIEGGTIHCFYIGYPQSEKRDWDGIVTRMSFSLRP